MEDAHGAGVASPPPTAGPPHVSPGSDSGPPVEPRSELDEIRQRLHELQVVLGQRFSRQSWDEYLRLRRTLRAQRL